MKLRTLINYCLAGSFILTVLPLQAQDKLAALPPQGKRVNVVEQAVLQRVIKQESSQSTSLYSSWNTNNVHAYAGSKLPESFDIDLRGFSMPCDNNKVTSHYGYRPRFRRNHKGVDLKVYTGDPIYAAFDGKVRLVKNEPRGYGLYIVIRHNNGLETIYAHLSKQLVVPNQEVKAGETIGLGGNTGRSTGSHLHFETRLLGYAIDPELLFNFGARDVTRDIFTFSPTGKESHRPDAYSGVGEDELIDDQLAQTARTAERKAQQPLAARTTPRGKSDEVTTKKSSTSTKNQSKSKLHKVEQGETLYSIAKKYGLTTDELTRRNGIKGTTVRIGQVLKL